MSKEKAKKHSLEILGTIKGYDVTGVKPELVMEAPIPGVTNLLKKMKLTIDDIDLVEHNEAFSSASAALIKEIGIPIQKFNIHGGAIALGHPMAAVAHESSSPSYTHYTGEETPGSCDHLLRWSHAVSLIVER